MGIFSGRPGRRDTESPVRIVEVNDAERVWMDTLRAGLPAGVAGDTEAIGRLFDEALAAWLAAPPAERLDPNPLINSIGVAVGDAIRARIPGARWAVATDSDGSELAVVVGPLTPDSPRLVPLHATGRRWSQGTRDWVPGYVTAASEAVQRLTADLSVEVRELATVALEHAVRSVVPEGGPLVPFAIVETAEGRALQRCVAETLEEGVVRAYQVVRESGAQRGAVAWDGYLTADGRRTDAVFVRASDAGAPSLTLAYRYEATRKGTRPLGGPVELERGPALL